MKLADLNINSSAIIQSIEESGVELKLFEFGILPGRKITIAHKAPFGGPIYIKVDDNLISLRKKEALTINVE